MRLYLIFLLLNLIVLIYARSNELKSKNFKLKFVKPERSAFFKKDFLSNVLPKDTSPRCGYNSCTGRKPDAINVHIINHSHDDVGWLKTVDQYFYGNKNNVQRAGVQYIIDSVVSELAKDPKRKFIFVETSFFKMWWDHQNEEKRNFVKQLVNEGRFEFISGGWSMNDEAASHYISIIDQMTLGHQWLINTFGYCATPRIGWQIDPFGHSREYASLISQMGFDGLFFGRLDHDDKTKRENEKTMEMIWRGSDDLGKDSDIFTGVLPNGYNPPGGFCFDDTCADEPIVDDKTSPDYNVERRVNDYVNAIKDQAKHYKTKDLIHTMGSDFQYQNAIPWYLNLDRLMKYVNEKHPEINVFYSTPTCYVKALNEANQVWPTKTDDFFPYSSDNDAFWAGYFTSRPAFKGFERFASNHLQSTKHLQVMAGLFSKEHDQLRDRLREALGVSQHHDAITGTEKQNVYSDYVLNLDRGIDSANQLISKALDKLHNSTIYSPQLVENEVEFCKKLNVSECKLSEEEHKFVLHLYNPVSHTVNHLVRLPVTNLKNENSVDILNSKNEKLEFELVDIPDHVKNLPERKSKAEKEIVFLAKLDALSLSTFVIDTNAANSISNNESKTDENNVLEGLGFKLFINKSTGLTQKVVLADGTEVKFEHDYKYYYGMNGDNSKTEKRASGAYIFRNNGTVRDFVRQNSQVKILNKKNLDEVHVKINDYVAEVIKVHKNLPYIEFDWTIGPIPVDDLLGKEIITTFKTDLKTNGEFYTDSNGRQLLKRVRNQRPTYSYNASIEPVASNYYPLNSKGEIRDEEKNLRMAVILDRSQGGSSLNDGEFELMIHRRLLHDDAFGVGEALNEPGLNPTAKGDGLIVRGNHKVLINSLNKENDLTVNELAFRQSLQPLTVFRKLNKNVNIEKLKIKGNEESLLRADLPKCVNLLSLESFAHFKLVRFEHLYGKIDRTECSDKTIELNINEIFNEKYKAYIYAETYLSTAHFKTNEIFKLEWKSDFDRLDQQSTKQFKTQDLMYTPKFKLRPTEIKTFLIFLGDEADFNSI